MPGNVLQLSRVLTFVILTAYFEILLLYPYFTEEETEAQEGAQSHRGEVAFKFRYRLERCCFPVAWDPCFSALRLHEHHLGGGSSEKTCHTLPSLSVSLPWGGARHQYFCCLCFNIFFNCACDTHDEICVTRMYSWRINGKGTPPPW